MKKYVKADSSKNILVQFVKIGEALLDMLENPRYDAVLDEFVSESLYEELFESIGDAHNYLYASTSLNKGTK